MTAIVDVFRITLENCGKSDTPFIIGGTLQRKKSRIHSLDAPKEMARNLSETQLVQFGSKAISNVADQFSKLSQTFSPKIRTGKKITGNESGTDESPVEVDDKGSEIGNEGKEKENSDSNDSDVVVEKAAYAKNSHSDNIGIVMGSDSDSIDIGVSEERNVPKLFDNLSQFSISSVTDDITMPNSMLDNIGAPDRSASPAPEICVQDTDEPSNLNKMGNTKLCRSTLEVSRYKNKYSFFVAEG